MHWIANSQGSLVHSERARDDPTLRPVLAFTPQPEMLSCLAFATTNTSSSAIGGFTFSWQYLCLNSEVFVKESKLNSRTVKVVTGCFSLVTALGVDCSAQNW